MASKFFLPSQQFTKKGNIFVLILLQLVRQGGRRGQKIAFLAQKGPFWAISARKRAAEQPNGHLPENRRYPELPQDMGKL